MFWDIFYNLCSINNTTPNAVCKELNLSNATATHWKNGTMPKGDALSQIADYFNCSVDYLLGRTDTLEKNTIDNHNATITDSVQAIKSPVTISGKENKDSNDIMTQFMEAFSDLPFENKVAALNFILEMKKSA